MAGYKGRESGRRTRQRIRAGWDFREYTGVDREKDAGAVKPSSLVKGENIDPALNPGIHARDGLTKETSSAALDSKVLGIWDLESYLE